MLHTLVFAALSTLSLVAGPRVLLDGSRPAHVKVNASTLLGVPGIAYEVAVNDHLSFNVDATASLWRSIDHAPYLFVMVLPEWQLHARPGRLGYYAGVHSGLTVYRLQKWNYRGTRKYQQGYSTLIGVSVGYKRVLRDRWLLDAFVGGGNQFGRYRGYDGATGEQYTGFDELDESREWLPYRLGLMFSYRVR